MMVPHCVRKLITATADLESVLDTIPDTAAGEDEEDETEDTKLIRKAKVKLEEAKLVVKEEELDDENTSTHKSDAIEETVGVKQNNMTEKVALA